MSGFKFFIMPFKYVVMFTDESDQCEGVGAACGIFSGFQESVEGFFVVAALHEDSAFVISGLESLVGVAVCRVVVDCRLEDGEDR